MPLIQSCVAAERAPQTVEPQSERCPSVAVMVVRSPSEVDSAKRQFHRAGDDLSVRFNVDMLDIELIDLVLQSLGCPGLDFLGWANL